MIVCLGLLEVLRLPVGLKGGCKLEVFSNYCVLFAGESPR